MRMLKDYETYDDYVEHQKEKTLDPVRRKKWLGEEWDFVPFECNVPSSLDFSKKVENTYDKDISMDFVSNEYLDFFERSIL